MIATSFHEHFESEFALVVEELPTLKRASSRSCKWRLPVADGSLSLSFATNARSAGLNPAHWPGEFRLTCTWSHGPGRAKKGDEVSYFQYTTDAEAAEYAHLQRQALDKFLGQPGAGSLRGLFSYATDPDHLPRANVDEFAYYVDAEDARAWGRWYRNSLPGWARRFSDAPETREDWCWRVLWPHLKRGGGANAG